MAVAMSEEPGGDNDADGTQDEDFVADDEGGQDHEGDAADGDYDAGGYAAEDGFERGPHQRSCAKDEEAEADPHDASEAGEFGGEFAGGVFVGGAEFGFGASFFSFGDENGILIFDF